jgi:hypothetical protein
MYNMATVFNAQYDSNTNQIMITWSPTGSYAPSDSTNLYIRYYDNSDSNGISVVQYGPRTKSFDMSIFESYSFPIHFTVSLSASAPSQGVTPSFISVNLPTAQTITWNPVLNQVVGTPYTVNASAPGGTVTYASSNTSIATISGTTVSFIAPGSVVITASQSGDETYYPAADVSYTFTVAATEVVSEPPACFVAGTRILTPEGYKAVETLRQGSLVTTADGRAVSAKIYSTHLEATNATSAPYTIPAGSFGLKTELTVSPMHAFQMRKGLWMIPAAAAKMNAAVVQKTLGEPVTYYHIECPQYFRDNLVVDGIVVESYSAKQMKGMGTPYTWSKSLKGFTRATSVVGSKITTPQ